MTFRAYYSDSPTYIKEKKSTENAFVLLLTYELEEYTQTQFK
jgi:hypothetical protein